MKVNKDRVDVLKTAINRVMRANYMDVLSSFEFGSRQLTFGVNWSACGMVTPEAAIEYAKHLTEAAALAETLNGMAIEVVYGDDTEITTSDAYRKAVDDVIGMVSKNDYDGLRQFTVKGIV